MDGPVPGRRRAALAGRGPASADPEHAEGYRERAAAYAKQLESLDAEVERQLAAIPPDDRELVTSHDALGYFADRYGLEVVATPFPASGPEAEASAQSVQEVEEVIDTHAVPALFAEETDDPQVLEQIADRKGVEIVDDLLVESPGESGGYVEMLRRDAELIAEALAPSGGRPMSGAIDTTLVGQVAAELMEQVSEQFGDEASVHSRRRGRCSPSGG